MNQLLSSIVTLESSQQNSAIDLILLVWSLSLRYQVREKILRVRTEIGNELKRTVKLGVRWLVQTLGQWS